MTVNGQAGKLAADLRISGTAIRMRPEPSTGAFSTVLMILEGGSEQSKPVEEVLSLANVKWQAVDGADAAGGPRALELGCSPRVQPLPWRWLRHGS